MNKIEIKPICVFVPLNSEGVNYSHTSKEWHALCLTFGFRYDEAENGAVFHFYDNETTVFVTLTQESISELRAMHNTDGEAHTLYSKLIELLEITKCESLLVKTSLVEE